MPIAAAIGAVGSIGSGILGYFGSQNAANAQVQSQQAALAQQKQFFNVLQGAAQPLINTGQGVLTSGLNYATSAGDVLKKLLTPGANMTATLSQIPGFTFAQDWGQKAVQNLGTATGLGGNTLKAGADYATGVAQQGYGSIVNSLVSLLGGGTNLAGVGGNIASSGVNALSTGAINFSSQGSNTLGNIGNAQASGILGSTNALSGGIGGAANSVSNAYLLSKLGFGAGGSLGAGGMGINPGGSGGIYSAATGGFYADGGDPPVGQPSLVGERGPELFVPDQPGTILPAEDPRTQAYLRNLSQGPVLRALTAAGNAVAPNLTDYLINGPSPQTAQSLTPYASGKLLTAGKFAADDLVYNKTLNRWQVKGGHPSGLGGRFVPPPQ